jgi:hypothetical protein
MGQIHYCKSSAETTIPESSGKEGIMLDTQNTCPTVLIADNPTTDDKFAHSSIAGAIADTVTNEIGGKCIGLVGSWGSGKSSVIALLKKKLPAETRVLVFDAWAHEGDPLRRTLLETLIEEILDWCSDQKYWKKKKELLSQKRVETETESKPIITRLGAAFVLTLFLSPVGLTQFTQNIYPHGGDVTLAMIGLFVAVLPLLIALVAYLSNNGKDVIALLSAKSHTSVHTESLTTPNPTSIEFQDCFSELIRDVLKPKGRRLVLVVDNLDRIDSEDALSVWATLRTFFDLNGFEDCDQIKRLWVMIPFDNSAIKKLWQSGSSQNTSGVPISDVLPLVSADEGMSQSFIDKTFQMVFHVPEPVLSFWSSYLNEALKTAFPFHKEQEFHLIYRLFDHRTRNAFSSPTPRDIKRFVNRMGAIHRQWQDRIELPIQALYVAFLDTESDKASALLSNNLLRRFPEDQLPSRWREKLAAIAFNVEVDDALQVLLSERIRKALTDGESEALGTMSEVSGFCKELERVLELSSPQWVSSDARRIAIAAATMNKALSESADPSVQRAWRRIEADASKVTSWSGFDADCAEGLVTILARHPSDNMASRLSQSIGYSLKTDNNSDTPVQLAEFFSGLSLFFEKTVQPFRTPISGAFRINGSAKLYISVCRSALEDSRLTKFVDLIGTNADRTQVIAEFASLISQDKIDPTYARVVEIAKQKLGGDWTVVFQSAGSRLAQNTQIPRPQIEASLGLLLRSADSDEASKQIQLLCQQSFVLHHLYFSVAEQPVHFNAAATCITAMLLYYPQMQPTSAGASHWNHGLNQLNSVGGNPAAYPEVVEQIVQLVAELDKCETLISNAPNISSAQPLVNELLSRLGQRDDSTTLFTASLILDKQVALKSRLGTKVFHDLICKAAMSSDFISAMVAGPFSTNIAELYLYSIEAVPNNEDLRSAIVSGLRTVRQPEWLEHLKAESLVLELLLNSLSIGIEPELGASFLDALIDHALLLISGAATVSRLRDHWFQLPLALAGAHRGVFFTKLIDTISQSEKTVAQVLALYGESLIEQRDLVSSADRLVIDAIPKMLKRDENDELAFVAKLLSKRPDILDSARNNGVQVLKERLTESYASSELARKHFASLKELQNLQSSGGSLDTSGGVS